MPRIYIYDKEFTNISSSENPLQQGEYESCTFSNCIFTETDLSDFSFETCIFNNCDLSNAKITHTAFKDVEFRNCKLMGLQFDECNPFLLAFRFVNCQLNLSAFYGLKLKNTRFENCILNEVDFTDTNLSGSTFKNCDFSGTMFGNTNLEKADFRTSVNFSINPETNRITKARFSTENITGLLDKYNIRIE